MISSFFATAILTESRIKERRFREAKCHASDRNGDKEQTRFAYSGFAI